MTSLNPRTNPERKHRSDETSGVISRHSFRGVLISRGLAAISKSRNKRNSYD